MVGRGRLHNQSPIKSLATESLMRFPGRQHFLYVVTVAARGIKHILCDTPGGGLLEAPAWFPPDVTPGIFIPLPILLCYPFA